MAKAKRLTEEAFRELLKENGYKGTSQRYLVLRAFYDAPGEHLRAEDVYARIQTEYPDIGLATIYRTIQVLLQLQLIDRVNFDDGSDRFELKASGEGKDRHHHHHLICRQCGKVRAFHYDRMEVLEAEVEKRTGFLVEDHEVKLFGLCKRCQAKLGR